MIIVKKMYSCTKIKKYYKIFWHNGQFLINNMSILLEIDEEDYIKNLNLYHVYIVEDILNSNDGVFTLLRADVFENKENIKNFISKYIEPRVIALKLINVI